MLTRPKPPVRHVLARILDEPALVAEVRALPPAALTKLIAHVGLEDAGELVALATSSQIAAVFDEDLWTRAEAGADETFDADRFVVWLEILLEAGERVAARRLAELDADVVTLAFHRLVHVIDVDALATEIAEGMHEDGDDINRALENALSHEIGEHMIIARSHDGWDAIVRALVAFDEVEHDECTRLLARLAAMTERAAEEEGGLHTVLGDAESLADDVAGDRNERRAREGFIAPADARAFLRLAREQEPKRGERDPVTKAYFRELDRTVAEAPKPSRLLSMLDRAGVTRTRRAAPKALGAGRRSKLAAALSTLPPARQSELMEELAYLVNVLLAGDKRSWRPAEAAEAVVAVVEAGLVDIADGIVHAFRAGVRAGKLDEIAKDRGQ